MSSLPDKIVAVHHALEEAAIPHAFGGALALAWCTGRARGTIDIDVNVFVPTERAQEVLAALPKGMSWGETEVAAVEKDGQVRVWWEGTPVDVFANTTEFHEQAATRVRQEQFAGEEVPFLDCGDLAVFKAFFSRTKDWADLEEMAAAGTLDVEGVVGVLARYLGPDDERVDRVLALSPPASGPAPR
jgi:hypothetical protein